MLLKLERKSLMICASISEWNYTELFQSKWLKTKGNKQMQEEMRSNNKKKMEEINNNKDHSSTDSKLSVF